jgi:drug/metabolite transporter (DMT)-like permease
VRSWAYLALLFNALVWGLSWLPLRHLQEAGLHPVWATMLFFALGALMIGLWRPGVVRTVLGQPALLVLALVSGVSNATFNWGVATGDVVRVVLLFYLMPLWAALLARVMLNEQITRAAWWRMGLALSGAILVLKPEGQAWPQFGSLSDVLGLLGGMGFAMTNVMLRQQSQQPAVSRAFAMFAGCTLLPGLLGLVLSWQGLVNPWPAFTWAWGALVLAMAGIFFASNLALQYGAAKLPVQLTSVLMITEVLFAAVSAALWGEATLTPSVLMGGGLILSAALLAARSEH